MDRWKSLFGSSFGSPASSSFRATRGRSEPKPVIAWQTLPAWPQTFEKLNQERAYAQADSDQEDEVRAAPSRARSTAGARGAHAAPTSASASASEAIVIDSDDEDMRQAKALSLQHHNSTSDSKQSAASDSKEYSYTGSVELSDGSGDEAEEGEVDDRPFAEQVAETFAGKYTVSPSLNNKIRLHQGDITRLGVDAVTNAANTGLWAGGGICGAIFSAACEWKLERACKNILRVSGGRCPTGETRLTRGFDLPAKYILHTVGPTNGSHKALAAAYTSNLQMAAQPALLEAKEGEVVSIRSLALCCISTGIFGFSNEEACVIALQSTRDWLDADPERASRIDCIVFCTFLKKDQLIYEEMLPIFFPVEPPTVTATTRTRDEKATAATEEQHADDAHPAAPAAAERKEPSASDKAKPSSQQQQQRHQGRRGSRDSADLMDVDSSALTASTAASAAHQPIYGPQPAGASFAAAFRSATSGAAAAASSSLSASRASAAAVLPSQSPRMLKRKSEEDEDSHAHSRSPHKHSHQKQTAAKQTAAANRREVIALDSAEEDQQSHPQPTKKQQTKKN